MRYRYTEPGEHGEPTVFTVSEQDILASYYAFWCQQMRRAGKADLISEQACIDDFVVVHWAEIVPDDEVGRGNG